MYIEELPGYEEATKLGYCLSFHSGDKKSASYTKGRLCLTVNDKNQATLSSVYKLLVEIRINSFAFPHKNIELFESRILECLPIEKEYKTFEIKTD